MNVENSINLQYRHCSLQNIFADTCLVTLSVPDTIFKRTAVRITTLQLALRNSSWRIGILIGRGLIKYSRNSKFFLMLVRRCKAQRSFFVQTFVCVCFVLYLLLLCQNHNNSISRLIAIYLLANTFNLFCILTLYVTTSFVSVSTALADFRHFS